MNCPKCGHTFEPDRLSAAQAFARLARGVPRRISETERTLRRERMRVARAARWPAKENKP
jgi:hypothetical protein